MQTRCRSLLINSHASHWASTSAILLSVLVAVNNFSMIVRSSAGWSTRAAAKRQPVAGVNSQPQCRYRLPRSQRLARSCWFRGMAHRSLGIIIIMTPIRRQTSRQQTHRLSIHPPGALKFNTLNEVQPELNTHIPVSNAPSPPGDIQSHQHAQPTAQCSPSRCCRGQGEHHTHPASIPFPLGTAVRPRSGWSSAGAAAAPNHTSGPTQHLGTVTSWMTLIMISTVTTMTVSQVFMD